MITRQNIGTAVGFALLYTSPFYLANLGDYFLPSVGRQVVYPTVIAVLVLTPAALWFVARYGNGKRSDGLGLIVAAVLCLIAIVGAFSAAGYSALGIALLLATTNNDIQLTRWIRICMVAVGVTALVTAVYSLRRYSQQILRFLSILGYTYALLAAYRLMHYPLLAFTFEDHTSAVAAPAPIREIGDTPVTAATGMEKREVVWIILDELDYDQSLGASDNANKPVMPNLDHLTRIGVSATNANSPARDTVASLPALLTGYPLSGWGFKDAHLLLNTRDAGVRRFQESDSIFARLPGGPESAAILGFYHPYCSLFPSVGTCIAFPEANVGRWFDALTFFGQPAIATARLLPDSGSLLPGALFRTFEPMYRITEDTLRDIPILLSREDKSLVFIHVNLPHPPGDYSQRALHFTTVGDDRENYRRNLRLADQIVATAVSILQSRSKREDILLIVSSDHWHRIDSPMTPKRIPWVAWHVGESDGMPLSTRVSTVHTGDLVIDFLEGRVNDQAQIVTWWQTKPFDATVFVPGQL